MAATPVADLKNDVIEAIMAGSVPCVWGDPGCGKTEMMADIARILNLPMFTIIGSLCDPTDINGFAVVSDSYSTDALGRKHKVIEFAPRDYLHRIDREFGGRGFIFLDEFTGNTPSVQAAMLTSITSWKFGDYQLDRSKVAIVCAANPPDIAANGQELAMPMVNRLMHLQFPKGDPVAIEWAGNYATYWGNEPVIKFNDQTVPPEPARRARAFVAGFISRFPKWWSDLPKENTGGMSGYPTARSWDRVGRHLGRCLYQKRPPLSISRLVMGEVGPAAAGDFNMYLRDQEIPDPEEVLKNPEGYMPSGRLDVDFVVMTGVVAAVAANLTPQRLLAGLTICNRVASARGTSGTPTYEAGVVAFGKLAKHLSRTSLDAMGKAHKMKPTDKAELVRVIYDLIKPYQSLRNNVLEAPLED